MPVLWHGPEDLWGAIPEQQGRQGGAVGRKAGPSLSTDSPCLLHWHCSLQAGVWLALSGSVHWAAVAHHGGGNCYNSPRKAY